MQPDAGQYGDIVRVTVHKVVTAEWKLKKVGTGSICLFRI